MSLTEDIKCPICKEVFVDPRPLPCGHCYCGSPRTCLETLFVTPEGRIQCAVCRREHRVKTNELPALFGIRDFIQNFMKPKKLAENCFPCSKHADKEGSFWCSECELAVCDDCFDDHDGHLVRKLKKYLIGKIEANFGKPWHENMMRYRRTLCHVFETKAAEMDELSKKLSNVRAELEKAQEQVNVINTYLKFLETEPSDRKCEETYLLQQLSKLQPSKCAESAAEEDETTETSKSPSLKAESTSKFVFAGRLRVQKRDPLLIHNSDTFEIGQLRFWLQAKLVDPNFLPGEQMLRIIINCGGRVDGKPPPAFNMRYRFKLKNNANDQLSKKKEGTWNYPEYERLFWHAITYSDLSDAGDDWFVQSDKKDQEYLSVQLEVIKLDFCDE